MKTEDRVGRRLAALLPLLLALSGCAHAPTLVGKWQGTTTSARGVSVATTFDFSQDGKETMTFQATGGPMSMTIGGSGTYTVSGNSLTQNITSMSMGATTMALPPGQAKPQASTFTLDGDHLTLTNPATQQSLSLTRVKE